MTEKKYIITKSQLEQMQRDFAEGKSTTVCLTPVAPMTLDEIAEQSYQIFGFWGEGHSIFARAIERYILGELE